MAKIALYDVSIKADILDGYVLKIKYRLISKAPTFAEKIFFQALKKAKTDPNIKFLGDEIIVWFPTMSLALNALCRINQTVQKKNLPASKKQKTKKRKRSLADH